MKHKLLITKLMILCMLFLSSTAALCMAENQEEFISINTARVSIKNQNIQKFKETAIDNALSSALQGAIAKILPAQILALNLEFLYQNILNKPLDYIITHRVIKTIQNEDTLMMAVESKVNTKLLEKTLADAKIIYAEKEKPTILFFIHEKTPLNENPGYWWYGKNDNYSDNYYSDSYSGSEEIIISKMLQKQFLVIGNELQRPAPSFYNIVFSSVNDVSAAIALGRKMKADIVIIGSAVSSKTANRMGDEKSFNADIDLTAYDTATKEKAFASEIKAAAASNTDEDGYIHALSNAARLCADDIIEKLDNYWERYLRKQQSFDLRVSGNIFLPRFIAFKQELDEIQGVEAVLQKEAGTGSALLEIRYKGSSNQFADAVMLKSFDNFGLEIIEVTDKLLDIRLVDKAL